MKELEIFDTCEDGRFLISLGELIRRLEHIDSNLVNGEWEIKNGAYGYGELICSIEDYLNSGKRYFIEGKRIFSVLKSGDEYFYNASMKKMGENTEIGIFDSSYLFFRSENDILISKIKEFFKEVKIINQKG